MLDCFVEAGSELQRVQVASEADAFTFAEIAGHEGVDSVEEDYSDAESEDILADLRAVTSEMDELQVSTGSRILFNTPTLKGALDDFSQANPARGNRVLARFSRIVDVPQVRFWTAIDLLSGESDQFGYRRTGGEYAATGDDTVNPGKTYYMLSGGHVHVGVLARVEQPFQLLRARGRRHPHQLHGVANSAGAFEASVGERVQIGADRVPCVWGSADVFRVVVHH